MPPQNSQFPNSTPPILNPNKKDNKFVLLIILGLILIAINIFFVYQTYFQNTEVVEDEQNLVVDEAANWKTYRNEEYGFEFKYPSTYSAKMFEESTVPGNLLEVQLVGPKKGQYDGPPAYIGISIWNNSKQLSLMDWAKENSSFSNYSLGSLNTNLKNEILLGHKAISYSWAGMGDGTTVVIENGQNIILLDTMANNKTDQVWQDFDSILSTFKFISTSTQTIDTTNWKTYRNEGYGFEIKYPDDWNYIYYTDNHGMEFNPRDPDCQCDIPSQLYITYYKSYSDFKIINNKQEENIEAYIKNNFSLEESITRNIDGFDFVCGRTDGIGDPTECVGKTKDGYIFFMTYNTGDKESESVIYTFKFTK